MRKYKTRGYINGIIGAMSYGTNPLFALPMYSMGLGVNSVLFYRYLLAVLIYGVWLIFFKKVSLKIKSNEFFCLVFLAILFAISSITLFQSFRYIDSGLACTILFVYPILVAIISAAFFKEKITKTVLFAIFLTSIGILLLYGGTTTYLNIKGIIYVLSSALSYATYMVLVKHLKIIKHIKYDKLSFYVMLFGLGVFAVNLKFCTQLQQINDWRLLACAFGLAFFPTIISLETTNIAIRLVGSTTTAILGALEPLTAIFFGVLFFKEVLTLKILIGILLIISGVIFIILRKNK